LYPEKIRIRSDIESQLLHGILFHETAKKFRLPFTIPEFDAAQDLPLRRYARTLKALASPISRRYAILLNIAATSIF
jgi:hypothetical protein